MRMLHLAALGSLLLSSPATAVDGVIEINQARAEAGGVTASDTPGFPVTLDAAGSYRLTGNLTNPSQTVNTIEMRASLISLDLNGFTIGGPAVCAFGALGTTCNSFGTAVLIEGTNGCPFGDEVRNGTLYGSPNDGLRLCASARVDNVQVLGAFGTGIKVSEGSRVSNSVVAVAGEGIQAPSGLVFDSVIRDAGNDANAGFNFGVDGTSSSLVVVRNLYLFRIYNNAYFRNAKSIGTNVCDAGYC